MLREPLRCPPVLVQPLDHQYGFPVVTECGDKVCERRKLNQKGNSPNIVGLNQRDTGGKDNSEQSSGTRGRKEVKKQGRN